MRISNIAKLAACLGFLLSVIAFAGPAPAAGPTTAADPSNLDWRFSIREDARQIFSTRTLTILGVGGMLSLGAHAIEDADAQAKTFDRFGEVPDFGNAYGSSAVVIGGAATLAAWGWMTRSPTFTAAGVDIARACVYGTVIVGALKVAVDRTRPDGDKYSFPSGHASAAFAVAPVVTYHFGAIAGTAAYACATATLIGRMEDRRHYLSDVVFGAAIGLAMGEAVIAQRRDNARRLMVEPDRVGLRFGF